MKILVALLLLYSQFVWPNAISETAKIFAHAFQYRDVKISPDGSKLALLTLSEGRQALVVLSSDSFKLLGGTNFKAPKEVGEFYWATDERLLISVAQKRGWEEKPSNYGEIFGVDFDGSHGELLFGYSINASTPSLFKSKEASRAWGEPIHRLSSDPNEVLIKATPMSNGGDRLPEVKRLNIHNGILSNTLMVSPISYADFLTDQAGNIISATGTNDDAIIESYWRDHTSDSWQPIDRNLIGSIFQPVYFNTTENKIYALSNALHNTSSLIKFTPGSEHAEVIFNDPAADIDEVIFNSDHSELLAIKVTVAKPKLHFINPQNTEAQVLKAMYGVFPDKDVSITSSTRDGERWIVLVRSDIDTPTFYLFNKTKGQLVQLFKNLAEITPQQLAKVQPFNTLSSDGLTLHGYYTPGININPHKPSPAVIIVHGGPRARDDANFDRLSHMLSQQGYGVVKINFRGSSGFGDDFVQAGNRHWGDLIQRDIFEATQYAQQTFNLDKDRTCIMGTSFGAYSSLQSSILYPKTYRCVIANAGVYDLELLKQEGDVPQLGFGKAYLSAAVGNDASQLAMFSPIYNTQHIQAPLLIAHGKQDKRAPYEHAEKLIKSLKKSKKNITTFIKESEGHGFYNPEIRAQYFSEVLKFLHKFNPTERPPS